MENEVVVYVVHHNKVIRKMLYSLKRMKK